MSIIAKYKFDSSIYANLIPEFNAEFTNYNITDEVEGNIITRTIESDSLPTLMRLGRSYANGETDTDNRTDSLLEVLDMTTVGLTDCNNMFRYCKNLTSITCEWDTSKVTDMNSMFDGCSSLTSLDVSNFNTSKVSNMYAMFYGCNNLTTLDVNNFNTCNVTSMGVMFAHCNNLTSLDVSNFNTSNVNSMQGMFYKCSKLTTLDVSNFDTSKVTNMKNMFFDCKSLTSLDVSNFNTSKVTDMQSMFYNCTKLTTLDLSNFNTSKVTNMQSMFDGCNELTTLDVNNFNTSKVTNMYAMFYYCDKLTTLDVSNFNTCNVTSMRSMFNHCEKLTTLDVSNFNTNNVTDMNWMFAYCHNLTTLDVSNFNTNNVTDMTTMFYDTFPLTDIGMIYCDQSTIDKVASLLPTDITQTIWVEDVDIKDLTPVNGVVFKQYAKNTEVMLTSPLLEGDKLIVKDGKLYHYHKMGKIVLDGSENYVWKAFGRDDITHNRGTTIGFHKTGLTGSRLPNQKKYLSPSQLFSDRFKVGNHNESYADKRCITTDNTFNLCFDWNELPERTSDGVNQWLQQNPTTVVYELETPYYELISEDTLDISLITESSDITNSSNIPLNMTINNRGLSTVAMSPSTTYTIVFDKDTDGEVVVNLCGNEVTTTDNIVEITTPSEINDELIFYGDGVEVSNVRLLEGSVSGDSVPKESFEGLQSSFEDGYIPENLMTTDASETGGSALRRDFSKNIYKSATVIIPSEYVGKLRMSMCKDNLGWYNNYDITSRIQHFSCNADEYYNCVSIAKAYISLEELANLDIIVLEGDWTHLTEEDWNNLGKYKVEYKVTGKNKFNGNYTLGTLDVLGNIVSFEGRGVTDFIEIKSNTPYIGVPSLYRALTYDKNKNVIQDNENKDTIPVVTPKNAKYIRFSFPISDINNIQLEEGTVATEYEPYKEDIKTYYLSSPLLEGDTIEDINGVATHVKRYGKAVLDGSEDWYKSDYTRTEHFRAFSYVNDSHKQQTPTLNNVLPNESENIQGRDVEGVYITNTIDIQVSHSKLNTVDIDGLKQWLSQNPITVIYQLASPIYEPISTESILCDSYVNGHLDVDTNIPIEKVDFKYTQIPLRYMQGGTNYTIQFNSDNVGKIKTLYNGNSVYNVDVVKGLNKILLLTSANPKEYIVFDGIGFNASNIQVVATDRDVDFGYFKGLSSSFEEKIYNGDDNLFNKNSTIYEGLNEDITMKWFVIEKPEGYDCITIASKGDMIKSLEFYESTKESSTTLYGWLNAKSVSHISEYTYKFTTDNPYIIMAWNDTTYPLDSYFDRIVIEKGEKVTIDLDKIGKYKVECKVVGKNKLNLPYTEQNKLYTDGSSWSNKFSFNVIKDKTYTFSLKSDFENVDGSSLTWALMWSSIFSSKEYNQIYKTTNGKTSYTFTADKTGIVYFIGSLISGGNEFWDFQLEESTVATSYEPYQEYIKTIYLNSPLLKGDKIEVHNGKLCHYHKMGKVVLDGSEDEGWVQDSTYSSTENRTTLRFKVVGLINSSYRQITYSDRFTFLGDDEQYVYQENNEGICATNDKISINILKSKISGRYSTEFKQWLQANPTTVVYELAEPYYEEISQTQEDLIITSVKEGDLHIDTIVPISSKVTYNVNVQLLTDFEQSIVEQVQVTQTTDLQSILDEEIDN